MSQEQTEKKNIYGLPDSVIIGGHEITVKVGEKQEVFDRLNRLGEFDSAAWTIDLSGKMHPSFARQVLCHELIHAMFALAALEGVNPDLEEKIATGLENHLYRMLVDNDFSFLRPVK